VPSLVFVAAAMAAGTILEIADAFFEVLSFDLGRAMLVAFVAGIALIGFLQVTEIALSRMIPIETKEVIMVKAGWLPGEGFVAIETMSGDLAMHFIGWFAMAACTILTYGRLQQFVAEALLAVVDPATAVLKMAALAIARN